MPCNFVANSFYTQKNFIADFHSSEVRFSTNIDRFAF